jgi:hypothetical protein
MSNTIQPGGQYPNLYDQVKNKQVTAKANVGGLRNKKDMKTDTKDELHETRDKITLSRPQEPNESQKSQAGSKASSTGNTKKRSKKPGSQSVEVEGYSSEDYELEEQKEKGILKDSSVKVKESAKQNSNLNETSLSIRERHRYNNILNKTPKEIMGDVPPHCATVARAQVLNNDPAKIADNLKFPGADVIPNVDLKPIGITMAQISDECLPIPEEMDMQASV